MKILFIGPQGSGKSTQGKLLGEYLKIPVIATGDILRQIASQDCEEGRKIQHVLSKGKLVDDKTISKIVEKRLKQKDCKNGFIIDGYLRTLEQIKLFDPLFDKVIFLDLDDEEVIKRLLARAREDDTRELIAERLKAYHKHSDPILDYYKQRGILISINGSGSIEDIQQKIRDAVNGQE